MGREQYASPADVLRAFAKAFHYNIEQQRRSIYIALLFYKPPSTPNLLAMSPFDILHTFYAGPERATATSGTESNASNVTHETLSPYFLGPQGENADQLVKLLEKLVRDQVTTRKKYHPEDGVSYLSFFLPYFMWFFSVSGLTDGDSTIRVIGVHLGESSRDETFQKEPGETREGVRVCFPTAQQVLCPVLLAKVQRAHPMVRFLSPILIYS